MVRLVSIAIWRFFASDITSRVGETASYHPTSVFRRLLNQSVDVRKSTRGGLEKVLAHNLRWPGEPRDF